MKHRIILVSGLALVSSFLFAVDDIKHPLTGTFIPQEQPIPQNTSDNNYQDQSSLENIVIKDNNSTSVSLSRTDRDGSEYTFTNCGASGTEGPSQTQSDNTYAGTSLDGSVLVANGIQEWIVPESGDYSITAAGASGGYTQNLSGGQGRAITVELYLSEGDILHVLVGQEGGRGYLSNAWAGGGGGGTFIMKNSEPLLISGGGGGAGEGSGNYASGNQQGVNATAYDNTSGADGTGYSGSWSPAGTGGTDGNGGNAGGQGGAGGGGYYGNGNPGHYCGAPGDGYLNGGSGGINQIFSGDWTTNISGGFGGGSGAGLHRSYEANAGGGGGYSGGGGSATRVGAGGGGGNYYTGTYMSSNLNTGNGSVVITSLAPPNAPPTATAQSVTGNEDSPQTITLAGSDPEGDALTYALATNPSNGTSTLSGNVVTYTPSTNYNGSDNFTFTVSDGELTSSAATVTITITPVNDVPTASAQSASGNEDDAQTITLAGNDVDGDALTYALATNPSNGTAALSGNVVTYTPNTNYNGSDSFTFTVSDAEYTSSAATVSITVASVNDVPVISSTPSLDALDGSLYEYSISVNDIDGDVVAITATGPNWLTVDDGILSGTPSLSDGGLHNIVLSADDGNGGVVTQSYTLAVSLHSLVITGESGHRIFSSPVSGTIYGDLLDELWTQGAEGSDSPNSNPNIWTYGNGWNSVTDFSSDALTAGKGFLMYIFADTDFDGDDDLNDPENPVIISIDGAQQESGVSVVSEPSGWNLIGNPYGLSVDISQMLSDNNGTFNSTIYALDHTNPGYKIHNGVVGNIENDEIKPFDGFWIKADADGNVFEFTEQSILKGSLNNAGRTTTDDSNGSAMFTFTNGDYSSSTYLSFTPEGQINLDPADAYRLVPMSPAEHLTSMIYESNKSLAINNLPFDLSTDISFPMDVMMLSPTDDGYATQTEQVDLIWDITDLPEGITLELTNNVTGQNINLTGDLSAIISLPSKGSFLTSGDFMGTYPAVGQSQFTLSVYGTLAAVEDDVLPERLTLHSAYPNPFNPSTLIRFDLSNADMVSLDIFDIAGKQVASLISEYMIPGSHQINWNPGNLSSGLYLVNLVVGTETFNQKITFIKQAQIMNNKLTTLIIIALSMLTFVLAQDGDAPLALPGAVNQGPIGGMAWLAISGLILAAKKYLSNNKQS